MKRIARKLGTLVYWLGWPFFKTYFMFGERTRLLVVCGNDVLMVSGWLSDRSWSMPGGGLHTGEDPAAGVVREVYEETGVRIAPEAVRLLGKERYHHHGFRYAYYLFVAEVPVRQPLRTQWHEIADAEWIDYRQLAAHNARPDVLLAIERWQSAQQ
jgi:8-oxo-dGTP pyrophosphatase MutT (NUDIX family)